MSNENAIQAREDQPMVQREPLTANEIKAQVRLIQEVMHAVMQKDVHYGIIPGTQKNTLYKAGAEKLFMTFHIGVNSNVEDLSTGDEARYRVTAEAINMATGERIGTSVGECSSHEEKYKWRRAVCDEEFDETAEDMRREKWGKKKDGGTYKIKQVRTNKADVANTILKMADKRANVGLCLKVTAASDIFTQDLEDMSEETREAIADTESVPAKAAPAMPHRKSEAASTKAGTLPDGLQAVKINIDNIKKQVLNRKDGSGTFTKWIATAHDGKVYETIFEDVGSELQSAYETSSTCEIAFKVTSYGNEIKSIKVIEQTL